MWFEIALKSENSFSQCGHWRIRGLLRLFFMGFSLGADPWPPGVAMALASDDEEWASSNRLATYVALCREWRELRLSSSLWCEFIFLLRNVPVLTSYRLQEKWHPQLFYCSFCCIWKRAEPGLYRKVLRQIIEMQKYIQSSSPAILENPQENNWMHNCNRNFKTHVGQNLANRSKPHTMLLM